MAGGISIHVIDVTRAVPAVGMAVEVHALAPERRQIARGVLSDRGTFDDPIADGTGIEPGQYEVVFHIGDYYRAAGFDLPSPAFLEDAPFRLGVADASRHYHLPLKMSPWGFSLFRGG